MKRHHRNEADTISKALLARKLVAGKRDAAKAALPKNTPDRPDAANQAYTPQGLQPGDSTNGGPRRISEARAKHYGLYSPTFKVRSYLYKMRGFNAYDSVPGPRDFIWSCIGSFAAILILLQLDAMFFTGDQLLLLGSFGASCVIIFGAPHSPFAQPRSVIGGQVLSATAGALVYTLLGEHLMLAAPMSVTLAFAVMQLTKTMHPPGGATSLIAGSGQHVVQQMGIWYPLVPVGAGITLLFLIGLLINNLSRNRQYPLRWF
ncbi:HPP family protein [Desulfovibrio sp. OttesenSCG-928-C06]|nr:HPP family protein [Desulfovibrio sp. OttesenSCG-928-C06]